MKPRILLIIALLIAIALVSYLLVRPRQATAPTNTTPTNEQQQTQDQGLYMAQIVALQRSRDERRLVDIRTIQSALEAYRGENENGEYPVTIDELATTYLSVAMSDPKTNQPYDYVAVGGDQASYMLTFFLEVGVQGYAEGRHVASPSGITP